MAKINTPVSELDKLLVRKINKHNLRTALNHFAEHGWFREDVPGQAVSSEFIDKIRDYFESLDYLINNNTYTELHEQSDFFRGFYQLLAVMYIMLETPDSELDDYFV